MNRKSWWAYAVDMQSAVLVRCKTRADAVEEKDRMKAGVVTTVGFLTHATRERAAREAMESRGWRVVLVRDYSRNNR